MSLLFWLCYISVSVLRRQFPSLIFPLVYVGAGMLGLCVFMCECINECLHCFLTAATKKKPGCLPLMSTHKSIFLSFYCINSILFHGKSVWVLTYKCGCTERLESSESGKWQKYILEYLLDLYNARREYGLVKLRFTVLAVPLFLNYSPNYRVVMTSTVQD